MKCRQNIKSKNTEVVKKKNGKKCFYQTVQCVIVKNWNFLNNKKLEDYQVV